MLRGIGVTLALVAASPAAAAGFGSSYGFGSGGLGLNAYSGYQGFGPSFDLHVEPVVVQFHALELIDAAADGELFLGANVYYQAHQVVVNGPVKGVVQPGLSIDLIGDPTILALAAECRLGAQVHKGAGIGVYVVPALGIVTGDGDTDLFGGGALQVSAWFSK